MDGWIKNSWMHLSAIFQATPGNILNKNTAIHQPNAQGFNAEELNCKKPSKMTKS